MTDTREWAIWMPSPMIDTMMATTMPLSVPNTRTPAQATSVPRRHQPRGQGSAGHDDRCDGALPEEEKRYLNHYAMLQERLRSRDFDVTGPLHQQPAAAADEYGKAAPHGDVAERT